jgi:hypothetical protein
MKRILKLSFFFLLIIGDLSAQDIYPLNQGFLNIEVHFTRTQGPWINGGLANPRGYARVAEYNTNNYGSGILSSCNNNNFTYATWGVYEDAKIGKIIGTSSAGYKYYFESWNSAAGYCTSYPPDETLYGFVEGNQLIGPSDKSSVWKAAPLYNDYSKNNANYMSDYIWRRENGTRLKPLDFGPINPGNWYKSENANRSAPDIGTPSTQAVDYKKDLGYTNDWTGRTGSDVTYTFSLDKARSLYAYVSDNGPAALIPTLDIYDSNNNLVASANNGSGDFYAQLNTQLIPGTYRMVVESQGGVEGDFSLLMQVYELYTAPGTITLDPGNAPLSAVSTRQECPGSYAYNDNIDWIQNLTSASFALAGCPITYDWKRSNDGGAWFSTGDTDSIGSQSNNGKMETYSIVRFRRAATACGNTAYSNIVTVTPFTVNATSSGSITGGGTIPVTQEIVSTISSSASGVASPSVNYSWKQSINGLGTAWQAVNPAQNTADFIIPDVSTMGFSSGEINSTADLEIRYKRRSESSCDNAVFVESAAETVNIAKANGKISGTIKTKSGGIPGPNGIKVYAHRFTPVQGGLADKLDSAITTNGGQYDITDLYYGRTSGSTTDEASYYVSPFKELHGFSPDSQTVLLKRTTFHKTGIDFNDTTGFVIKGFVTQECPSCDGATLAANTDSLKNVAIDVKTGALTVSIGTTGSNGQYAAIITTDAGDYIVKPEFETHQFDLSQDTVSVGTNNVIVKGVNFRDTTTHVISVYVVRDTVSSSCNVEALGEVQMIFTKILDPGNGVTRIKKTITTNSQGYYAVRLPGGKYRAEVQDIFNIPSGQDLFAGVMKGFLNRYPDSVRVRDITNNDTTMTLIYYEKPQIVVTGLTPPLCDSVPTNPWEDYTIFKQGVPKTFTVDIFRGNPGNGCRALTDTLKMATNIEKDGGTLDTLVINGHIELTLIGGEPNTVPPDYVKTLSFAFKDKWLTSAENVVLKPIVTGIRKGTGSFLTVSPEIPFLILRDPPGDLSYSYLESGSTIETANSYQFGDETEIGSWVDAKIGTAFTTGLGFSTDFEVYGSLGGSLSTKKRNTSTAEFITTTTNTTRFSTDGGSANGIVGESGDVFVGAAINLTYSKVKEVLYDADSCKFKVKDTFMMADSGFATTYVYTESHIRNTLLPIIRNARDLETNQEKKDSASNQINVWEQTLQRSQDLKKASILDKNYSFDGSAGPIEESITSSASQRMDIEFDLEMDADIALKFGMEVSGSGISGGSNVRMRKRMGGSTSNTSLTSTTAGFVLDDNDAGDYFSVNVKKDPVYNTPVFELAAGTSSCPHELGTQPRDRMEFYVPDGIKENLIEGLGVSDGATYQLKLANSSESEEARDYYVRFVGGSADGAVIDIDLNSSAIVVPRLNMPYNTTTTLFAGVKKQLSSNTFTYPDIRFQVFDGCSNGNPGEMDIMKEVAVFAGFVSPCSPINLALPIDNFKLNTNTIQFKFDQYVHAQAFDFIALQYASEGSNIWSTPMEYAKALIDNSPSGHQRSLIISALTDGKYKFRARLKCGINTVYSKINHGIIDRKAPEKFGDFEPADKSYILGDVISASFNEDLGCQNFEQSDFTLKRKSNNATVPAVLGCYQNQVVISPNSSILTYVGDTLLVTLKGVTDLFGNENQDTLSWFFGVGTSPASTSSFTVSVASNVNQIMENSADSVAVTFTISQKKNYDNVIYYNLGGNAVLNADYNSIKQNLTIGSQGSITIDSNEVSKTIYLMPINDGDVELDETVVIELSPTAEYGLAANSTKTITILNDDLLGADCDNNGDPFTLSNNNGGSSAIIPGTYHKLILNSDGTVDTPTTVVFKGEKSITLNPGFKIEAGSVFTAILEDCSELLASSFNEPVLESKSLRKSTEVAVAKFEEYTVSEMNDEGIIALYFNGLTEFGIKATLYHQNAREVKNNHAISIERTENESIRIHSDELNIGVYYLKIEKSGRTRFHRFVIQ